MENRFEILKSENYHSYLPLDITAVHFSEPGAMGYPGVLRIITSDKHMFMVRYLYDQWRKEDIALLCPVIVEFPAGMEKLNDKWKSFYMGSDGTHTMFCDLVKEEFTVGSTKNTRWPLKDTIEEMFEIVKANKNCD
jgi:hypothetical protein